MTEIKYNGLVVATVEGGNTATLPVKDKTMKSDIVITVPEASTKKYDGSVTIISATPEKAAGLYETGTETLIKSWDELLDEGVVHVEDGVVFTNLVHDEEFDDDYNESSSELAGDLVLPNDVISIGEDGFTLCDELTGITIPDSVTSIGICAFYWCDSLESINIPDSVTSIGGNAFRFCNDLTTINVAWAEGEVSGAPWGAPSTATINYNYTGE